jgi:4,5-dihydroxyphthalate decarboxylase
MATATKLKLHTMLGNYPNTKALKSGAIRSDLVDFDFVEVKVANNLFKQVVRDAKYDVAELAIVTSASQGLRQALCTLARRDR